MMDDQIWNVIDQLRKELSLLNKELNDFKIHILEEYSKRLPVWASWFFMVGSSIIAALITFIAAKIVI